MLINILNIVPLIAFLIVIIIYLNNELYSLIRLIIINYMHTFTLSSGKI